MKTGPATSCQRLSCQRSSVSSGSKLTVFSSDGTPGVAKPGPARPGFGPDGGVVNGADGTSAGPDGIPGVAGAPPGPGVGVRLLTPGAVLAGGPRPGPSLAGPG